MDGFGTVSFGNNCGGCLQYFFITTTTTQEVLYIYFNRMLFFKLIHVKKKMQITLEFTINTTKITIVNFVV